MIVEKWSEQTDGPLSEDALRRKLSARGFRVTRYTYPPGTVFAPHTHDIDKCDAVLSGRFELTVDDGSAVLEAGDCLLVPRGVRHSARVIGAEAVVSLDGVFDQ
jgi:quercetin dioxygenase-like cupin family protein